MHCQTQTLMSACQELRQMHHFNHGYDGFFFLFLKNIFLKNILFQEEKIQKKLNHLQYTFDDFLYKE